MRTHVISLVLVSVAACGDNLEVPPPIDARPIDARPIDAAVDGPCGMGRYLTGELVDIDSTNAAFVGVADAEFTQRGGTAMDATSPNGRFEMCVPSTTSYLFDVNAPATHGDGIAYFEAEAIGGGRTISFRTWTPARAQTFYTERGLTYDPTKAHVFVFAAGDVSNLTLSGGSHGTVQAANGGETTGAYTWAAGAAGRYVLFPNVDATAGEVMVIGDLSGPHTVPVAAGRITFVAAFWVFL